MFTVTVTNRKPYCPHKTYIMRLTSTQVLKTNLDFIQHAYKGRSMCNLWVNYTFSLRRFPRTIIQYYCIGRKSVFNVRIGISVSVSKVYYYYSNAMFSIRIRTRRKTNFEICRVCSSFREKLFLA